MKKIKIFQNIFFIFSFGLLIFFPLFALLEITFTLTRPFTYGQISILIFLYVLFGILFIIWFLQLFRYIEIDSKGIKILFFKKIKKDIKWDEISYIEKEYKNKETLYKISTFDGNFLYIVQRKKIKKAFQQFGNKRIQKNINNI